MKHNTKILILLFVGVLMGAMDISFVGPVIPSIEKTIHMADRDVSWIFSVYVMFNLVGISLMARLSDNFGRKWIYVISMAIFGIGSLIVAYSHEMTPLLIGRAIQGFGSSGIFPVATAVIGDVFPVEKRGRALGMIGAVFGIAFILGPFIAGFVLLYFDWNTLFLINIPITILLMIFSFFLLPGKTLSDKPKMDWEGLIFLAIILTCFTLGIYNIKSYMVTETPVIPLLLAVALLTPIFLMFEIRQKNPVLNVRLFKTTQIRLVGFVAFGIGLFQSNFVFLPKLAVTLFGVEPSVASFMLLPVVLMTAFGSPLTGLLIDRIGSKVIVISGLLITSIGLFLLSLLTRDLVLFYISEGLLGLGLSVRSALNYIMLNEVSAKERASTQGVLIIFISIGQLSGAAFLGAFSSLTPGKSAGFHYAFISMAFLSVILLFIAFFLKSREREIDDHKLILKEE